MELRGPRPHPGGDFVALELSEPSSQPSRDLRRSGAIGLCAPSGRGPLSQWNCQGPYKSKAGASVAWEPLGPALHWAGGGFDMGMVDALAASGPGPLLLWSHWGTRRIRVGAGVRR